MAIVIVHFGKVFTFVCIECVCVRYESFVRKIYFLLLFLSVLSLLMVTNMRTLNILYLLKKLVSKFCSKIQILPVILYCFCYWWAAGICRYKNVWLITTIDLGVLFRTNRRTKLDTALLEWQTEQYPFDEIPK